MYSSLLARAMPNHLKEAEKNSKTLLKANTEGIAYKKQEAEHSTQSIKRIKNLVTIFKTLGILSDNNKPGQLSILKKVSTNTADPWLISC